MCPIGQQLHGNLKIQSARAEADTVGGDKATRPADLLVEEDAFRRLPLDVALGAQLKNCPNGLKKLLHSLRMEQNVVQKDEGVIQ